jgi:ATP-dependent exoDNAse (exonuclease V) alpha subunit
MPLYEARMVDLGYASTSHAAQGSTVDRVLININSHRSPDLVNQRQLYVSLSRARLDACIYTNDANAMRRAVSREQGKELALDVTRQHQPRQSAGIRI